MRCDVWDVLLAARDYKFTRALAVDWKISLRSEARPARIFLEIFHRLRMFSYADSESPARTEQQPTEAARN